MNSYFCLLAKFNRKKYIMNRTTAFIILIGTLVCLITGCHSANSDSSVSKPKSPSRDSLESLCTVDMGELKRKFKMLNAKSHTRYYLNDELFTGWACLTDPENEHKYRYAQYDSGQLIRQIGYYANGQIDHEFSMKGERRIGRERMWMIDGHLSLDQYYSAPGEMHGYQKGWHSNHVLAREALFDSGTFIYKKSFDENGTLIQLIGEVPE